MKTLFLTSIISILISISAISQDIQYRKDERPQNVKEDRLDLYQVNRISELDILKALEIIGVRIFGIPISPAFEKEYSISLKLDEYINGKKTNSQDITFTPTGTNTYFYFEENVPYFDYLPKFTIFTHNNDTIERLTINSYQGNRREVLKKNIIRKTQYYTWRAYSKIDWKLNEEVPLLVFASSWYDERIRTDRFCGVADLSLSEEDTKELFDNSPHYYVISLKVYE